MNIEVTKRAWTETSPSVKFFYEATVIATVTNLEEIENFIKYIERYKGEK